MINYFEPGEDGDITVYLQKRRSGEQVTTTISLASLLRLRDINERFFAMVDRKNNRTVVVSVTRNNGGVTVKSLHRLLVSVKDSEHVYHRDKNGTNNRLDNLLIAKHGANLNKPKIHPPNQQSPSAPYMDDDWRQGRNHANFRIPEHVAIQPWV